VVKRARRRGRAERPEPVPGSGRDVEQRVLDESELDFHPDELREFLEADLVDVPADPEFKERLRIKLWDLVRRRYAPRERH
jgi:hypothetical protein